VLTGLDQSSCACAQPAVKDSFIDWVLTLT